MNARRKLLDEIHMTLFGATDEQAEFPIVYTNAILGHATLNPEDEGLDLQPLFDKIVDYLPAPAIEPDAPTQLLVSTLGYHDYNGRIAIGRLFAGTVRRAQEVARITTDGVIQPGKLAQVFVHQGLERIEVEEVEAGEIVAVTGLPEIFIGETIADPLEPKAPHFAAKAKNVIFLFMEGGPSQLDLFDPKPELQKWNGRALPESMAKNLDLAFIKPTAKIWPCPREFKQYGQCGTELTDWTPHLATCVDDICMVRSMYTEQIT